MHPLKDHLKRFADNYLNLNEKDISKKKEKIEQDLEQAQNLGFRDYVYVPFCICLISKYPYTEAIKNCLQSIYYYIHQFPFLDNNEKLSYNIFLLFDLL